MKFIKNKFRTADLNEAELLSNYRRTGDLELLGMLYSGYMPLVFGLCLKYLKDEELSKDAVMQIFEQLTEKLKKHEVTNFKSWLYTLARNHCLMALRNNSRHILVPLEESGVEKPEIVHLNIDESNEERLTVMERCMEKLPEEQRVSIDLFYLQQKCYQEVAGITGYDMKKVKSYIQNGKRNLKICMEKNSENE